MQQQPTFLITPNTSAEITPLEQMALGAMQGAEMYERETINWLPSLRSPDQIVNINKQMADARGRDIVRNDGYAAGAMSLHKDNIVGSLYRLNLHPNYRVLGLDSDWAEEFQIAVESLWNLVSESEECWLDAARRNTFTALVRLAVGGHVITGEALATAEWVRDKSRPFKTAVQMVSPDRLSNPYGSVDTRYLRRGMVLDDYGQPTSYHFRCGYPTETYPDTKMWIWKEVPARKPWGRRQVIHIVEQLINDQSRGISDMVAVLKSMRMTKTFQEVTLQNAVINASYAAAIESELPSADVFAQLGAGPNINFEKGGFGAAYFDYVNQYLGNIGTMVEGSKNMVIDGAKIPHLYPGTKLTLQPVGTPGGVGTGFEESMLRHIAAGLGVSYEQFSRDYSKTNYSSARASMNETHKFMQSRKKAIADRFATQVFQLWFEEAWNAGQLPIPKGKKKSWLYEANVKDALTTCSWIGASRGQIDELKETQAAILRIDAGISTYEMECARLGNDFRDIFEQRAREEKHIKRLGLQFQMGTVKPNGVNGATTMEDAAGGSGEPTSEGSTNAN